VNGGRRRVACATFGGTKKGTGLYIDLVNALPRAVVLVLAISRLLGEYWTLSAPRFTGTVKTKLRLRLDQNRGRGPFLYSNEFDGTVNPEQLGTTPGVMADKK